MNVEQLTELARRVLPTGTTVELVPASEHDGLESGEPVACVMVARTFDVYHHHGDDVWFVDVTDSEGCPEEFEQYSNPFDALIAVATELERVRVETAISAEMQAQMEAEFVQGLDAQGAEKQPQADTLPVVAQRHRITAFVESHCAHCGEPITPGSEVYWVAERDAAPHPGGMFHLACVSVNTQSEQA